MTGNFIQGSEEWLAARCGRVTASRISDVIAKTKTGWGASRTNYMAELIAERLTGKPVEQYTNAAMQWGLDTEPQAKAAYALVHDAEIKDVGLIPHPTIAMSAASPDGLVMPDGLVEVKCPNTATHIETLLGAPILDKYVVQMQWQIACTETKWCDFVSFDPRMPARLQLFVRRFYRDDARITELGGEVRAFLRELDEKIAALKAIAPTEDKAARLFCESLKSTEPVDSGAAGGVT